MLNLYLYAVNAEKEETLMREYYFVYIYHQQILYNVSAISFIATVFYLIAAPTLSERGCKSAHCENKNEAIASRKLVQLLMTHSTEAFDSEQNVVYASFRRIIKLGNKPRRVSGFLFLSAGIPPTQKFHSAKIPFVVPLLRSASPVN